MSYPPQPPAEPRVLTASWSGSAAARVAAPPSVEAPEQDARDTGTATGRSVAVPAAQAVATAASVAVAAPAATWTAAELVAPPPAPPTSPARPPADGNGPRGRMRPLRIGSHLASHAALAQLAPAGSGAGLVLGIDHRQRPVAVRLFRPEPTRVTMVGTVWAAQLLVFRAFAVGARVVVVSDHAPSWISFAQHATGQSDRLLAVAPESVAGAGTARQPTLVVDDRGVGRATALALGPWQTQLTVVGELDRLAAALVARSDLAVLQRLGDGEATLASHALHLSVHSVRSLRDLPDDALALVADGTQCYVNVAQTEIERTHVGDPHPRAVPAPQVAPPERALHEQTVPLATVTAAPPTPTFTPTTPPAPPVPQAPPPRPAPPPVPPSVQPSVPLSVPAAQPSSVIPPQWMPPSAPTAAPRPTPLVAPMPLAAPGPLAGTTVDRTRNPFDPYVTSADVLGEDFDAEERARRRRRPVIAGVVLVALLAVAGWVAGFVLTGTTPEATPTGQQPIQTLPQNVVNPRPLPVPTVTAVVADGGIRFSWSYPDPQPGDRFRVRRTDTEDQQEITVTEPKFLVPDTDHACLQVRLVRSSQLSQLSNVECLP